jgi:hypothetical protein
MSTASGATARRPPPRGLPVTEVTVPVDPELERVMLAVLTPAQPPPSELSEFVQVLGTAGISASAKVPDKPRQSAAVVVMAATSMLPDVSLVKPRAFIGAMGSKVPFVIHQTIEVRCAPPPVNVKFEPSEDAIFQYQARNVSVPVCSSTSEVQPAGGAKPVTSVLSSEHTKATNKSPSTVPVGLVTTTLALLE